MDPSTYEECETIYTWLNRILDTPPEINHSLTILTPINQTVQNHSLMSSNDSDEDACRFGDCSSDIIRYYIKGIFIPILCGFGITGNLINIYVLTRKRFQTSLEGRNKSTALFGLIALAVSDMLFCIITLPEAFLGGPRVIFRQRDFHYFYQIYSSGFQSFFAHLSTWLTVVMALSRYCAICKLQQSGSLAAQPKYFFMTLVGLVVVWILLILPKFWTLNTTVYECPMFDFSAYVIDEGPFGRNKMLKLTFSYIYAIFGLLIPLTILSYCNYHLIRALQESVRTRHVYRVHEQNTRNCSKITPTLIAVIFMFLFFCSPAEILSFCYYSIDATMLDRFTNLLVLASLLQTLNYSMNFLLYCLVNSRFRNTLKHAILCRSRGFHSKQMSFSSRHSSKRLSHPLAYPLTNINLSTVIQR